MGFIIADSVGKKCDLTKQQQQQQKKIAKMNEDVKKTAIKCKRIGSTRQRAE